MMLAQTKKKEKIRQCRILDLSEEMRTQKSLPLNSTVKDSNSRQIQQSNNISI
jgi:hypothetical protein